VVVGGPAVYRACAGVAVSSDRLAIAALSLSGTVRRDNERSFQVSRLLFRRCSCEVCFFGVNLISGVVLKGGTQ